MPRAVLVLIAGLVAARIAGSRTSWRHAILFTALGAQIVLALHALIAPTLTWRVVPAPTARVVGPLTDAASQVAVRVSTAFPSDPLAAPSGQVQWPVAAWLGAIWLAGALVLLLRLVQSHRALRHRGRSIAPSATCQLALRSACHALKLRRIIALRIDPHARQPYACGVWRPAIALPPASVEWTATEARAVLAHEVAHVARGDLLASLVGHISAALMWPNPLVHLVRRRAESLRERLADTRAVSIGIRPSEYVSGVITAVRALSHAAPRTAVPLARRRHDLEQRMRALLAPGLRPAGHDNTNLMITTFATPLVGLMSAVVALGLPAVSGAQFCRYVDGAHLDVVRATHDQRNEWLVQWSGDGCRVEWRATGTATFRIPDGTIALPAVGDSVRVAIVTNRASRTLVAFNDAADRVRYRIDDTGRTTNAPPAWLPGFLLELERHTAATRATRIPALLVSGGTAAVLAEAREMSGGHAGALYLIDLVHSTRLTTNEFAELLDIVIAAPVTNNAVLEQLLLAVAARAPLAEPALGDRYRSAANRLTAQVARDAAFAALTPATTAEPTRP